MIVQAISKNVRVSPYKVRLVVNEIKKLSPNDAVKTLDFVTKAASKSLKKTIMSAIANARNNNNLNEDSLKFKEFQIGHGIAFKRQRPIARGRAHSIKKRTSNIRVVLEGQEQSKSTTDKTDKSNMTDKVNNKGGNSGTKS